MTKPNIKIDTGFDLVVGTRPDIIKFAPLILELDRQNIPFHVFHEFQHTDYGMFFSFLKELKIQKFFDDKNSKHHKYSNILIYGDTDGAFRQAYHCKRDKKKIFHVEAGLRCLDNYMWEEMNRKLIDAISDYWLTPTETAKENLKNEGKSAGVTVTGNLINDTLSLIHLGYPEKRSGKSILITIHRRENIYNDNFIEFLKVIAKLQKSYDIIFPIHPHTKLIWGDHITNLHLLTHPVMGYIDFVQAMIDTDLIITDSGGVSEEACILHKKCIVLRKYTERPETLTRNVTLCRDYADIEVYIEAMQKQKLKDYTNPYASPSKDLTVAQTICRVLRTI